MILMQRSGGGGGGTLMASLKAFPPLVASKNDEKELKMRRLPGSDAAESTQENTR